jgi:hypothetical protein
MTALDVSADVVERLFVRQVLLTLRAYQNAKQRRTRRLPSLREEDDIVPLTAFGGGGGGGGSHMIIVGVLGLVIVLPL